MECFRYFNLILLSSLLLSLTESLAISPDSQMPVGRRKLPDKLLIGYANSSDEENKVIKAIEDGVNVIVWAFLELKRSTTGQEPSLVPVTSLDFNKVQNLIHRLDNQGYDDTVHLISFGGWNGPHLETSTGKEQGSNNIELAVEEWYKAWKLYAGDIFHGIDWDLEGHDDLESKTNMFTLECLEFMGQISQLAKKDGYVIGMAPPQSYLDIDSPRFSRYVNLQELDRPWHNEFHYFGANVYSYLLSKFGDSIDFVSVQFYESYSKAAMAIFHERKSSSSYLESYVRDLAVANSQSFQVNFEDDPELEYSSRRVYFPLSKLVLGFANGWAKDDSQNKTLFVDPTAIATAYNNLQKDGIAPRGLMYWVITEEGNQEVYFAKRLNEILDIRSSSGSDAEL